MNRKGEEHISLQIVAIVVGILAAFIIFSIVSRYTSKEGVYDSFTAKDAALLADTLHASPQSVRAIYSAPGQNRETPEGYAFLDKNFVGIYPLDISAGNFVYKNRFIPSVYTAVLPSSSNWRLFYMMKERQSLFISPTMRYILLK